MRGAKAVPSALRRVAPAPRSDLLQACQLADRGHAERGGDRGHAGPDGSQRFGRTAAGGERLAVQHPQVLTDRGIRRHPGESCRAVVGPAQIEQGSGEQLLGTPPLVVEGRGEQRVQRQIDQVGECDVPPQARARREQLDGVGPARPERSASPARAYPRLGTHADRRGRCRPRARTPVARRGARRRGRRPTALVVLERRVAGVPPSLRWAAPRPTATPSAGRRSPDVVIRSPGAPGTPSGACLRSDATVGSLQSDGTEDTHHRPGCRPAVAHGRQCRCARPARSAMQMSRLSAFCQRGGRGSARWGATGRGQHARRRTHGARGVTAPDVAGGASALLALTVFCHHGRDRRCRPEFGFRSRRGTCTHTWTGGSGSNKNLNDPANWGGSAPAADSVVCFPAGADVQTYGMTFVVGAIEVAEGGAVLLDSANLTLNSTSSLAGVFLKSSNLVLGGDASIPAGRAGLSTVGGKYVSISASATATTPPRLFVDGLVEGFNSLTFKVDVVNGGTVRPTPTASDHRAATDVHEHRGRRPQRPSANSAPRRPRHHRPVREPRNHAVRRTDRRDQNAATAGHRIAPYLCQRWSRRGRSW